MDASPLLAQLLYWLFLMLWSFVVAYVLVVRCAHVRLADRLNLFLFGEASASGHSEHGQESGHGDAHGEGEAHHAPHITSHGHDAHAPKDSHVDEHPPRLFAKAHGSHGHGDAPESPSLPRAEQSTDATDEFIVAQLARTK